MTGDRSKAGRNVVKMDVEQFANDSTSSNRKAHVHAPEPNSTKS